MTGTPQQLFMHYMRVLLAMGGLLVVSPQPTSAEPAPGEDSNSPAQSSNGITKQDAQNTGNDFTRPIDSLEVRLRYRESSAPGSETEKEYALIRATWRIKLDEGWKVSLYAETGGENKETTKGSATSDDAGLGDSVLQAALIREFNERWAAGAGARFIAPTASDDIGSGKWEIMPAAGFRYSFLELGSGTFIVPQMRYAVSVAGTHSTRDISELQMAPLFKLDLPGPWYLTLYPSYDIRINFGPPVSGQTGPLFLPADAEIGYKVNDHLDVALEGSVPIVKDYPVYNFKTQLRFIFKY
jgi:hypothetical protein